MSDVVLVEREGAVVTVTMNRPEQHNALNTELKVALLEAIRQVAADDSVRAVVLAGSGRSFCVGQDLGEHAAALEEDPAAAFETVNEHFAPLVLELMTMPKPVVAAVGGACVGAGLGIALACDLRVFGAGVKLATAFTGIGLTFDSGLSFMLPRAVGAARASELILLGRSFAAEQAVAWGISGEVVTPAEIASTAHELAAGLARGPAVAFAESKRLLLSDLPVPVEQLLANEAEAQLTCGATRDHAAAVAAFLSREKPQFTGK